MTQAPSFIFQYLYAVEIMMLIAGVIIAISSIDDLFVDLLYWSSRLMGTSDSKSKALPSVEILEQLPERPIAIMVPCWKEHDVIFSMLSSNSRLVRYEHAHYFVGVYLNDPLTQAEVRKAQGLYKNIHMVLVPHDGPTSKADCLNQTISDIFMFEAEQNIQFAEIVMHDSEDLIHPLELKLFNKLVDIYDFIQLPVYSFSRPITSMIAGLYMDEFAEMHTKDLEVRQRISGVIPCAGVSACFSREAIQHLNDQNQGEAFRTSSFTEDYDIAFRVSELGFNSAFIAYPANYAIDIDIDSGNPGILHRTLPVATREFFPSGLEAAYRQRARWLLGIVFQGSQEHGWKGSARDQVFSGARQKGRDHQPGRHARLFCARQPDRVRTLSGGFRSRKAVCLYPADARTGRCGCSLQLPVSGLALVQPNDVHRHDLQFASRPDGRARLVVGNFVNFFATWRAVRIYASHRISGTALVWDKTSHSYPVHMGDLTLPGTAVAADGAGAAE